MTDGLAREWMSIKEGANVLSVSQGTFPKYARAMGVRFREIPGRKGTLWHRGDLLEAIARLEAEEEARAILKRAEWDQRTRAMLPAQPLRPAPDLPAD